MPTKKLGLIALLAALSPLAQATPVTFDLSSDNSSVSFHNGVNPVFGLPLCIGCSVQASLAPDLDSASATLDTGDDWTFAFANLKFTGLGFAGGTIKSSLGFDQPDGTPPVKATGVGGSLNLGNAATGGVLKWDPIDPFTLPDGQTAQLSLEDLSGLKLDDQVTVHGTLSLLGDTGTPGTPGTPGTGEGNGGDTSGNNGGNVDNGGETGGNPPTASVPEPGTVSLLALGLVGAGMAGRRRRG